MKINRDKLDIALARECKSLVDMRGFVHPGTLSKIRNNPEYTPGTKIVGKLAKALHCDVRDLIEEDASA